MSHVVPQWHIFSTDVTHTHLTSFKIHSNFLLFRLSIFFFFSFTTFSFSLKKRKNEWHKQNDCLNRACSQKIVLFWAFVQMTIPMTAGVAEYSVKGATGTKLKFKQLFSGRILTNWILLKMPVMEGPGRTPHPWKKKPTGWWVLQLGSRPVRNWNQWGQTTAANRNLKKKATTAALPIRKYVGMHSATPKTTRDTHHRYEHWQQLLIFPPTVTTDSKPVCSWFLPWQLPVVSRVKHRNTFCNKYCSLQKFFRCLCGQQLRFTRHGIIIYYCLRERDVIVHDFLSFLYIGFFFLSFSFF